MKILAIYRHYWPDATPYAHLLKAILETQHAAGHEVAVFTAQPSYNDVAHPRQLSEEVIAGVQVRRVSLIPERKHWRILRLLNHLLFLVRAVWYCARSERPDLVIANSHPPILMGLTLRLIKRFTGVPFLLHCQDIHPEGAVLAGDLRPGLFARWCQAIDRTSCQAADRIVTLSEDMKQTLLRRGGIDADRIVVLNNFSLTESGVARFPGVLAREGSDDRGPWRLLFAGNMGRFQGLSRLLYALRELQGEIPLECLFLGAGGEQNRLWQLAQELGLECVRFESHQPVEVAVARMQHADLGIVSLADGVTAIAYPSKTMTYIAAGCPVLTIVEPASQVAADVLTHRLGYVPQSTSVVDIAAALRNAWQDRQQWTAAARAELIERGERLFGRRQALQRWNELFAGLDAEHQTMRTRQAA